MSFRQSSGRSLFRLRHRNLLGTIQDSKARKKQLATGFQSILDKSKLLDVGSSSWILLNLVSNAFKCVRYSTQGARVSSLFGAVSGYLMFAYRYQ